MKDFHDIMALQKGLVEANRSLSEAIQELEELAGDKSKAERDYQIAKSQATLKHKSDGMSATLIPSIVKGEIAGKLFNRDYQKELYSVCHQKIKALHTKIDSYRTLISNAKSEKNYQ